MCDLRRPMYHLKTMDMKNDPNLYKCRKCGRMLARSDFSSDSSRPDGVSRWCKKCVREQKFTSIGLNRTQRMLSRFSDEELQSELNRRQQAADESSTAEAQRLRARSRSPGGNVSNYRTMLSLCSDNLLLDEIINRGFGYISPQSALYPTVRRLILKNYHT